MQNYKTLKGKKVLFPTFIFIRFGLWSAAPLSSNNLPEDIFKNIPQQPTPSSTHNIVLWYFWYLALKCVYIWKLMTLFLSAHFLIGIIKEIRVKAKKP